MVTRSSSSCLNQQHNNTTTSNNTLCLPAKTQAHFIPSGTRLAQKYFDKSFLHDANMFGTRNVPRPTHCDTQSKSGPCAEREPTGRVFHCHRQMDEEEERCSIPGSEVCEEEGRQLATLPVRLGGLGLRSASRTALAAVEYTFIQTRFHPTTFSSNDIFNQ